MRRSRSRRPLRTLTRVSHSSEPGDDPELLLSLLRSEAWSPETVAACLRHVSDWLNDTQQHEAASFLHHAMITHPETGATMGMSDLIGEERAAARRIAGRAAWQDRHGGQNA